MSSFFRVLYLQFWFFNSWNKHKLNLNILNSYPLLKYNQMLTYSFMYKNPAILLINIFCSIWYLFSHISVSFTIDVHPTVRTSSGQLTHSTVTEFYSHFQWPTSQSELFYRLSPINWSHSHAKTLPPPKTSLGYTVQNSFTPEWKLKTPIASISNFQ